MKAAQTGSEPHLHAMRPHLSEDEIDDVLLELAEPDALEHLHTCALCQDKVSTFQQSMDIFNQATLSWAEAKSSTMPLVEPQRTGLRWNWAVASPIAASLLIGAALVVSTHRPAPVEHAVATEPVQVASATESSDPDPMQLVRDNAMLEAINTEMQPVESPLMRYTAGQSHGGQTSHEVRN